MPSQRRKLLLFILQFGCRHMAQFAGKIGDGGEDLFGDTLNRAAGAGAEPVEDHAGAAVHQKNCGLMGMGGIHVLEQSGIGFQQTDTGLNQIAVAGAEQNFAGQFVLLGQKSENLGNTALKIIQQRDAAGRDLKMGL